MCGTKKKKSWLRLIHPPLAPRKRIIISKKAYYKHTHTHTHTHTHILIDTYKMRIYVCCIGIHLFINMYIDVYIDDVQKAQ